MDANNNAAQEEQAMTVRSEQCQLPEMEQLCWKCKGRCQRCDQCDGVGYLPTEFGKKILALLRHNLKPILQDAIND
jgi:hypothetical protein